MGKYDKKTSQSRGAAGSRETGRDVSAEIRSNREFQKIAGWLAGVKFRKKTFGGLDPVDVWDKIGELNAMYEKAIMAERIRCDLLVEEMRKQYSADDLGIDLGESE